MNGEERDRERLREAFEAATPPGEPGPGCADTARIWAAARGELPPAEARALVDHAIDCATCSLAWRLAREVSDGSGADAHLPERRRWTAGHWAAVAAVVTAAVLVPVGVFEWRAPQAPIYRAEEHEAIRSLLPDGAALPRDGFLLRWTAGPPGTRYSVRLARGDLGIVSEADALDATEYVVPADVLAGHPGGTVLYWRVEAHLPDGSRAISDTFSVRLE